MQLSAGRDALIKRVTCSLIRGHTIAASTNERDSKRTGRLSGYLSRLSLSLSLSLCSINRFSYCMCSPVNVINVDVIRQSHAIFPPDGMRYPGVGAGRSSDACQLDTASGFVVAIT